MATFEGSDQITVKSGDHIPITKHDKLILKTLQSNSKNAQQGFDLYQKVYRYTKKRYGESPIKEDFIIMLLETLKNVSTNKEEWIIIAATAYDLRSNTSND